MDENGQPLPAGWTKITSRTHGKVFYHNTSTKQTSWEIPKSVEAAEDKVEVEVEAKDKGSSLQEKETPAVTPIIAASSPRVAPSGPASWRSAQGQGQAQNTKQGETQRNRERDVSDRGDSKRTRLSSPPSGSTNSSSNGNGNGNRYPSRNEPPRRTLFLFSRTSTPRSSSSASTWGYHGITCG